VRTDAMNTPLIETLHSLELSFLLSTFVLGGLIQVKGHVLCMEY
jgi:hypothetical protein